MESPAHGMCPERVYFSEQKWAWISLTRLSFCSRCYYFFLRWNVMDPISNSTVYNALCDIHNILFPTQTLFLFRNNLKHLCTAVPVSAESTITWLQGDRKSLLFTQLVQYSQYIQRRQGGDRSAAQRLQRSTFCVIFFFKFLFRNRLRRPEEG